MPEWQSPQNADPNTSLKKPIHLLIKSTRAITLGASAAAWITGWGTAAEKPAPKPGNEQAAKAKPAFPTLDILPEGSILRRVRLPRYDKDFNPTSLLSADKLTVLDRARIEGEGINIELYGKDGSVQAQTKMRHAIYNQTDSSLRATEAIYIKGKNYLASGTGLIFDWTTKRGFLLGPASTLFQTDQPDKTTSMQLRRPHPNLTRTCTLASTLLTLTTSVMAVPPPRLTAAQLEEMDRLTAPSSRQIQRQQEETKRILTQEARLAETANASMTPFLTSIGQAALLVQATPPGTVTPAPAPATPPDKNKPPLKPAETTLRVECDGGLYFDSDTGILAYLKNVRLTEPRFKLSCSQELKVFLEQEAKKPATTKDNKNEANTRPTAPADKSAAVERTEEKDKSLGSKDKSLGSFGGLERIIASGDVKVTQKDDNGKLFIATAETASYDAKTGEMILRGGRPRLQQSANQYLEAISPGQYIRIHKNGKLVTSDGKWVMQMTTKKPTR